MQVVGIDGCRSGWLCVGGRPPGADPQAGPGGRELRAWILPELGDLDLDPSGPEPPAGPIVQVAVDMPIGLPESGARPCDRQARRLLGHPRGTSVFPAPIRPMLVATSHEEACAIGRRRDGRALTIQAWNLLPRIRQLDGLRRGGLPAGLVREAHPELIFQLWAGRPLRHGKRRAAGRAERRALIEADRPGALAACAAQLAPGGWAADDLLDALACLHAAGRLWRDEALVLGGEPDGCGLPMEICG